jgi:2-dehydro-3-deoxyphosphogluconate aldolase/(4S)-4-hydroxy-2-oxoglutarate aldolase
MTKDQVRKVIEDVGIIPAIRTATEEDALFAGATIANAGIPIVELTLTVPGALDAIRRLRTSFPDIVVGAGTVLDMRTAKQCVDAGALFLTSPGLITEIVEYATAADIVSMPGALTPTELMRAHYAGANYVKIFPCAQFGGPSYIRALKRPFPDSKLIASGGVNQQTASEFILAGATAVGIGEDLIPWRAVRERKTDWIHELARRFTGMVKNAREKRQILLDTERAERAS